MKRKGWKKCNLGDEVWWMRHVLTFKLKVWYANGRYWGTIDNGASVGAANPAVVAAKLEARLGKSLLKMSTTLLADATR